MAGAGTTFAIARMSIPLQIKQLLVKTRFGDLLERQRESAGLRAAVKGVPEQAGMISQSACAKAVLPHLAEASSSFVDVGAHIGSILSAVRRAHPGIGLIAIEAVPDKAQALEANFPEAVVHATAVGKTHGTVSFYIDEQRPGYSSLSADRGATMTEITAPMRTLDELLEPVESISCIKIDVEGHELGVVEGGLSTLMKHRPAVQFESGPRPEEEESLIHDLFDLFTTLDYQLFVPNRVAHNGPPLSREGFFESHFYPFRALDYFALPSERRTLYRDRARKALGG